MAISHFAARASARTRFLASLMPGPKKKPTPPRKNVSPARRRGPSSTVSPSAWKLLSIDNRPLQREAWANFHTARKRLQKVARDLHRHEEIDLPAYEKWLHHTFPVWITTLRDLYAEVSTKSRQVRTVLALSELTGRSPKKLWREQREYEANPEAFDDESADESPSDDNTGNESSSERDDDSSDRDFFGDDEPHGESDRSQNSTTSAAQAAKDIYRRLVQRLHPDRGGDWNAVRQRLWHQVQQAWAAVDADWLARIEIEWETANDVLGPDSPLSRLRRAIEELIAARRDTERKLRDYRRAPQWRFTLLEKTRHLLHARAYANFRHDVAILQRQLEHLNRTIAVWEKEPRAKERPRPRSSQSRRSGT